MIRVSGKNNERDIAIECKHGTKELYTDLQALATSISSSFQDDPHTLLALSKAFYEGLMKGVSGDVEIEDMSKEQIETIRKDMN